MCPTSTALGALRTTTAPGPDAVQLQPGAALTRALDVAARVMAAANDRMAAAVAGHDPDGYRRAELSYEAAGQRYDELCTAMAAAGYYLGFASVPDRPVKVDRPGTARRLIRPLARRVLDRLLSTRAGRRGRGVPR